MYGAHPKTITKTEEKDWERETASNINLASSLITLSFFFHLRYLCILICGGKINSKRFYFMVHEKKLKHSQRFLFLQKSTTIKGPKTALWGKKQGKFPSSFQNKPTHGTINHLLCFLMKCLTVTPMPYGLRCYERFGLEPKPQLLMNKCRQHGDNSFCS